MSCSNVLNHEDHEEGTKLHEDDLQPWTCFACLRAFFVVFVVPPFP